MRPISSYVSSLMIGTLLFCPTPINPQSQVSSPTVVLEATNTIHGIGGYQNTRLLVRLTDDGKLEWDKWVGNAWESQVGSLTTERVSAIKRSLDAIDGSRMHDKMGPYHIYTDTSVELRVRLTTSQGLLAFTVMNPWSCETRSCLTGKPLPKDVKTVVCGINRVRAQVVSDEPIDPMCKTAHGSQ
jgi:hypothetical protein